jgi:uncharacterized protein (DUF362 family)
MQPEGGITRRDVLKNLIRLSAAAACAGVLPVPPHRPATARAETGKTGFIVEGLGQREGYSVKELVDRVFEAAGGIKRFISRGDVVVVKPNLSWARKPDLAATTNPEVLKAVVEVCLDGGAKKVRIADHTIHDAKRCFAISGAGMVAKETGADLVFPRSSLMRDMKINGSRLDIWPVFVPVVEADKLINLPIAKHHSLTTLTLGMKNWIGAVGGSRWALHQDIHQTIVDLARFFKPTVTLIDATRILTRNGPSSGNASDVSAKNTLILSDDPVAADAKASLLFGKQPEELGFIVLGQKQGLGTYELNHLDQEAVRL